MDLTLVWYTKMSELVIHLAILKCESLEKKSLGNTGLAADSRIRVEDTDCALYLIRGTSLGLTGFPFKLVYLGSSLGKALERFLHEQLQLSLPPCLHGNVLPVSPSLCLSSCVCLFGSPGPASTRWYGPVRKVTAVMSLPLPLRIFPAFSCKPPRTLGTKSRKPGSLANQSTYISIYWVLRCLVSHSCSAQTILC